MNRRTIGELIFWTAAAAALALYRCTMPEGLPWNPAVTSRYGRYLVAMAGGNAVMLACVSAAGAAGLLAALVNRHFGWRLGVASALVWMFLPGVWNRAITGELGVVLASVAVGGLWMMNAIVLWVTRKARAARQTVVSDVGGSGGLVERALPGVKQEAKRSRVNRIAGWVALGTAGLFAVVSLSIHDYRLGEAASAYARLIVAEAGSRVILMNGLCDEQIERALASSSQLAVSFRDTEANRSNLVAWVKREWPSETNLWLAAEIGPSTFATAAVKSHPDRFYTMNGESTTLENWNARWGSMAPYLTSRDTFIPAMRRAFAYEGNALGNRMLESDAKQAWNLYHRIFNEIHPGNPAACVNLNAMLRRGYKVDSLTRQRIESAQADYAKLLKDRRKARRVAEWISHFGPLMRDEAAYEKLRDRARARLKELEAKGDTSAMIPDFKTLEEWHAEMMKAFGAQEYEKAVHIARAILARPAWRGFIPANMVLGESMMMKGDWVAAEAFLRPAAEGVGAAAPPSFVLNDYAETLRQLKRCGEAEKYARMAVAQSDAKHGWIFRLTLAQVLKDKSEVRVGVGEEIRSLVREALNCAPREMREKIRKEFLR